LQESNHFYSRCPYLLNFRPLLMHQAQTNSYPESSVCETRRTGRWVGELEYRPRRVPGRASPGQNLSAGPGMEGPDAESGPIFTESGKIETV
jgi:hypothetical protein